jgi:hypothetical protein
MKRFLIAAALAVVTTTFNTGALADNVGQPGFYGRINIGGYRQPRVLYRQPIAIGRVPMNRAPIYLRVPAGHTRQWKKRCRDYNACGERVFFVQNNWYKHEYGPRYRKNKRGSWNNGQFERRSVYRGKHRNNTQGRGYNH